MKNKVNLILGTLIFCLTIQSHAQDKKGIVQGISISNFMAKNISDSELIVTVDYSFNGKTGSEDIFIHAFPEMEDGSYNFRDVNIEKVQLKPGNNQVSLKIIKRPQTKNFSSKSIKICMIAFRSEILCQKFPYTKSWKTSSAEVNIISFETSKTQANVGESVLLTWQTGNANSVNILEKNSTNIYKVEASGTMTVKPDKTTSYVILANQSSEKGSIKQVSKSVTIIVGRNSTPEILTFNIEPQNIYKGDPIRYYWEVKNAQKVQLYDSFGEIEMSRIQLPNGKYGWPLKINGEVSETLNKTETYILKATNNFGTEEKTFKVTVMGKRID